ncbi:MAG TPA: NUDIX domain-containing protein [Chitinophagales bacterium]|nr:NUDIX domain-containing protein [Chitinophagales bacterium]
MVYTSEYPKPAVTVDCIVFGYSQSSLQVLLIKRGIEPFKGKWALPGGFVKLDETLDDAARRELLEETGLENVYLEQLFTFGAVDRDPRERVISVGYFALINLSAGKNIKGSTDADEAKWFDINQLPPLAFDHQHILDTAINRLKAKIVYQPIVFELLPAKFIFSDLENIYETILQTTLNRRNFRTKIMATGLVKELNEYLKNTPYRPPKLFQFDRKKYMKAKNKEINLRF